jgi:hypothetical protein
MEMHKMGGWIGNGLGFGALSVALAVGIALIIVAAVQLVRHRHA